MREHLTVAFLGASRLVGLLELFHEAAREEDVDLRIISVEDDSPWHAVSAAGLCQVIAGPDYLGPEFADFIVAISTTNSVDVFIPCIDSATVALSAVQQRLSDLGSLPMVSEHGRCVAMNDKALTEQLFDDARIRHPRGSRLPLIAKPRVGASSRGITVIETDLDMRRWKEAHDEKDYILQPFVRGTEYTVDAYVSLAGHLLGAVARERVVITAGESIVTVTRCNSRVIDVSATLLDLGGWVGPITIQTIDDGRVAYVIECNPRFGSGVPCSIRAGLNVPRWILRERLGREVPQTPIDWKEGLCMTRSLKDHFIWLS